MTLMSQQITDEPTDKYKHYAQKVKAKKGMPPKKSVKFQTPDGVFHQSDSPWISHIGSSPALPSISQFWWIHRKGMSVSFIIKTITETSADESKARNLFKNLPVEQPWDNNEIYKIKEMNVLDLVAGAWISFIHFYTEKRWKIGTRRGPVEPLICLFIDQHVTNKQWPMWRQ